MAHIHYICVEVMPAYVSCKNGIFNRHSSCYAVPLSGDVKYQVLATAGFANVGKVIIKSSSFFIGDLEGISKYIPKRSCTYY